MELMKAHLLCWLTCLCVVSHALAGGTIDWNFHALPILKKHPDLLAMIENALDVNPKGVGIRVGKDFGEEQGKRMAPFEFPARVKGSTGPYNLRLIIHDPSGATDEGDKGTCSKFVRSQILKRLHEDEVIGRLFPVACHP